MAADLASPMSPASRMSRRTACSGPFALGCVGEQQLVSQRRAEQCRLRWGSRGRRFKSGRPDHCVAGQRPFRRVGEVASRSFDRTLTAGFGGILRHVAFTKCGGRHIVTEQR